jgi:hypothetical protein
MTLPAAFPHFPNERNCFFQHLQPFVSRRPAFAYNMFIQTFAGSNAEKESAGHQNWRANIAPAFSIENQKIKNQTSNIWEAGMWDIVVRFIVGGAVVSTFAIVGDVVQPKSFAGIFAAAPSVALGSLFLTVYSAGASFAMVEAHGMIGGALALFVYSNCVSYILVRSRVSVLVTNGVCLLLWLSVALGWLLT